MTGEENPLLASEAFHAFSTMVADHCTEGPLVLGAALPGVQDALGHADPRTTRRYDRSRHNLDRSPTTCYLLRPETVEVVER